MGKSFAENFRKAVGGPRALGSYKQSEGMAHSPSHDLGALDPTPEHIKGTVYPYRGTEDHGVPMPHGTDLTSDTDRYYVDESDLPHPDYMSEPVEHPPVNVRVVNESPRERRDWRPFRFLATDQPQRLIGRSDNRTGLRIQNLDAANPVYITQDSGVSPIIGYVIGAGKEINNALETTEDVWIICDAGKTAEISGIQEFTVQV